MSVLEIDLVTEAGRKKFHEDSGDIFVSCVRDLVKIQQLRNLTAYDKAQVETIHQILVKLATTMPPEDFRKKVPEFDTIMFMRHAMIEIQRLTSEPSYIQTGELDNHECVLIPLAALCFQIVPGAVAFESEFFQILADFVKARRSKKKRRRLPSQENCRLICEIVSNAYIASQEGFDNNWPAERVFKKLEESGILQQFLRCLTVPGSMKNYPKRITSMLDNLHNCPLILKKKFKRGQPCGDTLSAIIEGRDGSVDQESDVIKSFQTLKEAATAADPTRYKPKQETCSHCGKQEPAESISHMSCSRCKLVHYCSKACQKAHWKHHKQYCVPISKQSMKKLDFLSKAVNNFLHQYYVNIMLTMLGECNDTGLDMNEMIIELNFSANDDGMVPAMQNPPIFKITPAQRYIEGFPREIPDWIRNDFDLDTSEKRIQQNMDMIQSLDIQASPTTIIAHYADCVQNFSPQSGDKRFSQDAQDAFWDAMHQHFEPLSKILRPAELQIARQAIGPEFVVYNPPSDVAALSEVREILDRSSV
ncbi:unnamed protein product [Cylindrotheca closterium]|uniref:MYND-type domain-containing protein n=1 Tax=Cylindrotheca closterium TaxID=2856 RepID=A0AAD2PWP9_9STRA|nr:unnamed protein product [Cylindrotheca closterium]